MCPRSLHDGRSQNMPSVPWLSHPSLLPLGHPLFPILLGGRPPLKATSSATVFVNLLDLNDNDPTFQNLPFIAEVLEGTPAGVSVYQVSPPQSSSPRPGSYQPEGHSRL